MLEIQYCNRMQKYNIKYTFVEFWGMYPVTTTITLFLVKNSMVKKEI
jgi:hypothetical protein